MSKREADLERELAETKARLTALENKEPRAVERVVEHVVSVQLDNPSRNALQSVSDWWHGGSSQNARTRHMRVNY